MKCVLLGLMFSCLCLSTCYALPHANEALLGVNPLSTPSPALDYGYGVDAQAPTNLYCINPGERTFVGSNEGMMELNQYFSYDKLKNQISFDTEGKISLKIFTASAKTAYFHSLEQDEYSETFTYRTDMKFMSRRDGMPGFVEGSYLNHIGKNLWSAGVDTFRQYCGNSYISTVNYGGTLYVTVELNFRTKAEKDSFETSLEGKILEIAEVSAKFSYWEERTHAEGNFKVVAYQLGGDPTKLGRILDGAKTSICKFDNINDCRIVLNNAVDYASRDYPNQFGDIVPGETPRAAGVIGFETTPYFIFDPKIQIPSQVNQDIINMRNQLGYKLDSENLHNNRALYIKTISNLNPAYREQINLYQIERESSIHKLKSAGRQCFEDISTCVAHGQNVLASLPVDDPSILNVPATA